MRLELRPNCLCGRIRLCAAVVGLVFMLAGFAESLRSQDMSGREYAGRDGVAQSDPVRPSSQFVLNKLNDSLLSNQQNMDHIAELNQRIVKLEGEVSDFSKVKQDVDMILSVIKAIGGGIATIIVKEFLVLLHLRRKAKAKDEDESEGK